MFYQSQVSGLLPPTTAPSIAAWRGDAHLQDASAPFLNPTGGLYNVSLELLLGIGPEAVANMVNRTVNASTPAVDLVDNTTRRLLQEVRGGGGADSAVVWFCF